MGECVDMKDNNESQQRPPIGLEPRQCHDQRRSVLILDAMRRYVDAGKDIPMEWIDELRDYQL
jgi:hypothetical protein